MPVMNYNEVLQQPYPRGGYQGHFADEMANINDYWRNHDYWRTHNNDNNNNNNNNFAETARDTFVAQTSLLTTGDATTTIPIYSLDDEDDEDYKKQNDESQQQQQQQEKLTLERLKQDSLKPAYYDNEVLLNSPGPSPMLSPGRSPMHSALPSPMLSPGRSPMHSPGRSSSLDEKDYEKRYDDAVISTFPPIPSFSLDAGDDKKRHDESQQHQQSPTRSSSSQQHQQSPARSSSLDEEEDYEKRSEDAVIPTFSLDVVDDKNGHDESQQHQPQQLQPQYVCVNNDSGIPVYSSTPSYSSSPVSSPLQVGRASEVKPEFRQLMNGIEELMGDVNSRAQAPPSVVQLLDQYASVVGTSSPSVTSTPIPVSRNPQSAIRTPPSGSLSPASDVRTPPSAVRLSPAMQPSVSDAPIS